MKINKSTITSNEHSITFIHEIKETIQTEDGFLVLLKHWVYANQGYNLWNNVYKINKRLEIQWQIEGTKQRCYIAIVHNNGEYRAVDWDGISSVIDMDTGKIVREYLVK